MPSYRMHVPIGMLHRGASPADVMDQAELALGTLHAVEKKDVEAPVVDGRRVGRVALRFAGAPSAGGGEGAAARRALGAVAHHLEGTAATVGPSGAVVLTRGGGGRRRRMPRRRAPAGGESAAKAVAAPRRMRT